MKNNIILSLYKKPQTVFTLQEISLLFPEIPYDNLKKRMSYFAKSGSIKKLRRGVYVKDQFNALELANKLYTPSYVSLETVLQKAGVTFQYYESIFAVSYISRTVKIGDHTIIYRRMKKNVLLNKQGIEEQENVVIASPERAFLDAIYLYKDYHFDNLSTLDWDKISELKDLYGNRKFFKRVEEYYQVYKENHA
jgi:predicted transcriptional regulator of viral defense system